MVVDKSGASAIVLHSARNAEPRCPVEPTAEPQPFGVILIIDPKTCATARGKDISVNYSVFDKYFTETVFHIAFGHVFPWLLLGDWLII